MKGILMAGGKGSRLWPLTAAVNKHLMPIHNKPMIYYSLTTLMFTGVTEIAVISSKESLLTIEKLLGSGNQWGLKFHYIAQPKPQGIAQSFNLVPKIFKNSSVSLSLGDNLLYGTGLGLSLSKIFDEKGALGFAYPVSDTENYGIVELNQIGKPIKIVEKPKLTKSNLAIPGLYFFDKKVWSKAKRLKLSSRGEYEITDLLKSYLKNKELKIIRLERGTVWLDTGTTNNLLGASEYVRVLEDRQGLKIGCPEEVALRLNLITRLQFVKTVKSIPNSDYKKYLLNIES